MVGGGTSDITWPRHRVHRRAGNSPRVDSAQRVVLPMQMRDGRCRNAPRLRRQSSRTHSYRPTNCMFQSNTPAKPRVLILDEDRIILQSLAQFLAREGYEARTADEPADALAQLEAAQFELLIA